MTLQAKHVEDLETLAGKRGRGARARAAVRREDLRPLLELVRLDLEPVTAQPSIDEYNALLRQLKAVSEALTTIGNALRDELK